MRLAYVLSQEPGDTAMAFLGVAERLRAKGMRCIGVIEDDPGNPSATHPCDMALRILPDGPALPIAQPLGSGSRGCRLDPGVLEQCVVATEPQLVKGADLMIVNKFGKQEEQGRGFHALIGDVLALGIPVLVGVNHRSLPSFEAFSAGLADRLPCRLDAVMEWAGTTDDIKLIAGVEGL